MLTPGIAWNLGSPVVAASVALASRSPSVPESLGAMPSAGLITAAVRAALRRARCRRLACCLREDWRCGWDGDPASLASVSPTSGGKSCSTCGGVSSSDSASSSAAGADCLAVVVGFAAVAAAAAAVVVFRLAPGTTAVDWAAGTPPAPSPARARLISDTDEAARVSDHAVRSGLPCPCLSTACCVGGCALPLPLLGTGVGCAGAGAWPWYW